MSRAAADLGIALQRVLAGESLDEAAATAAVGAIVSGEGKPALTAALLVALRMKGETDAELAGAARALRAVMTPVPVAGLDPVDTCGTGGDGLHTFNISTAAAFVTAGAGAPVAKHGNRSVSSRCGSADVLEALGLDLTSDPERLTRCLQRWGMAFLFAPGLHPAMRHAAETRRQLGVRTLLNLVGPLANPASVRRQVLGVPEDRLRPLMARVLQRLGSVAAWVVTGAEGMDELTTTGTNRVTVLTRSGLREQTVDARDLGLPRARLADLAGGDAAENAERLQRVLDGERGPARDVVCLNAAAALVVSGRAADLGEGLQQATASLDRGAARRVLDGLRGERAGEGAP